MLDSSKAAARLAAGAITLAAALWAQAVPADVTADFAVVVAPQAATVFQGETRTVNVLFARSGGFSSEVTLGVIGVPDGVRAEFSPSSTATSSQLTLAASSTASAGSTTVIVSATGGGLTRYAALPVDVEAGGSAAVAGSGDGGAAQPGGCASAGGGGAGDLGALGLLALLLARAGRRRAAARCA